MLKTIGGLVVVAAIGAGIAWQRGWWTVRRGGAEGEGSVTFALDRAKVRDDLGRSKESLDLSAEELGRRIDVLRTRAAKIAADRRAELDRLIEQLDYEQKELLHQLDELKGATREKLAALSDGIGDALDALRVRVDGAIEEWSRS